jgi:hypothetical protein
MHPHHWTPATHAQSCAEAVCISHLPSKRVVSKEGLHYTYDQNFDQVVVTQPLI